MKELAVRVFKAGHGPQAARTQIAACKYTAAKVLKEVSYRAIHVYGSLGVTDLTPLQAMWAGSPTMSVMDGVDEVHKVTVARNVLKGYEPHQGLWPTEYLPTKRQVAREKFADAMARCCTARSITSLVMRWRSIWAWKLSSGTGAGPT